MPEVSKRPLPKDPPEDQRPGLFFSQGMFDSLANREFRYLWIGNLAAQFAMQMQIVARGWLIYAITSSPLMLTWTLLSFSLPTFLFSLFGGVIADRFEKKRVLMISQGLNFAATLVMTGIVITGHVEFMDFIYFGLFNGTVLALSLPARQSMIPEIVAESLLFNAMALATSGLNLSRVLGPVLAGGIIALIAHGDTTSSFGVGVVYCVISGLYLVSVLTLALLRYKGEATAQSKNSVMSDIREGLAYMWASPVVFGLIMMSFVPLLFAMPIQFLMPAFSEDVLAAGPDGLGLLMAAMGGGALLGSLAVARMGRLKRKGLWLYGIAMFWAVFLGVFAISGNMWLAMPAAGLVGMWGSMYSAINMSLVQLAVDQSMRGRVNSILMMSFGLMPLGVIPVGLVAEYYGIQVALGMSAVLLGVSSVLLGLCLPAIRNIDRGY